MSMLPFIIPTSSSLPQINEMHKQYCSVGGNVHSHTLPCRHLKDSPDLGRLVI